MFSLLSLNPFSSTEKGDSRTKKVGSSDLLGQRDTRLTSPNKTDLQTLHVNYTRYHLATNKIPPIVYIFCFALRLIFVILAFVSFGYDNIVLGNNGAMELRIKTITVTHTLIGEQIIKTYLLEAKLKVKTAVPVVTYRKTVLQVIHL